MSKVTEIAGVYAGSSIKWRLQEPVIAINLGKREDK
jgi:hypothetical protein